MLGCPCIHVSQCPLHAEWRSDAKGGRQFADESSAQRLAPHNPEEGF